MAKRYRTDVAGQLVRSVAYTMRLPSDDEMTKRQRIRISSAARQKMNLRTSKEKLRDLIADNYKPSDLVVTLGYSDETRPETKAAAGDLFRGFIRALRAYRTARGEKLLYIYTTEKFTSKHGHVHHHVILNATSADFAAIRALWKYGSSIKIQYLRDWGLGYEAIAEYLTKEPRICGQSKVGERTWTPSLGHRKHIPLRGTLKDSETITEPFGAIILKREEINNPFGSFLYLEYWVPEQTDYTNIVPPKME